MISIAIPLLLVLMSAILMWVCIQVKNSHNLLKVVLILVLNAGAIGVWFSLDSYAGWAARQLPQSQVSVHWIVISEPDKRTGLPGEIYFWISPRYEKREWFIQLLGYSSTPGEPKAIRIPYSLQNHKVSQKMIEDLKKGKPVMVSFKENGDAKGKDKKDGKDGEGKDKESNVYIENDTVDVIQHDVPNSVRYPKP